MAPTSLWIAVSVKRQGRLEKGSEIINVDIGQVFSDILRKIFLTEEENIEVRILKVAKYFPDYNE